MAKNPRKASLKKTLSSPMLLLLSVLFIGAFFLRTYLLSQNLFFGPEQGIDMFAIKKIVTEHHLTLIGSKTDITGIFHGPIYYYLGSIPFFLSGGNPLVSAFFFVFLNTLSVIAIYFVGKELVSRRVGIVAAVLLSVSFEAIVYARWLSNPPLSIPLVCLFFLCLILFIKGREKALLGVGIFYGLLGQAEFLNYFLFGVILLLFLIIYFKHLKKIGKQFFFLCALVTIAVAVGNYLLFDLLHHFIISKSVLTLLTGHSGYYQSLPKTLSAVWTYFSHTVTLTISPQMPLLAITLLMSGLGYIVYDLSQKKRELAILLLWILPTPVLLLLLRHVVLDQYFVGMIPGIVLLVSYLLNRIGELNTFSLYALLVLLIWFNLSALFHDLPSNKNVFFQSAQPLLRFADQQQTIDTIYKDAAGKPFSIQSYTIPFWMQEEWTYLFDYFGSKKYGYTPIEQNGKILYVIIQRDPDNPIFQKNWLTDTVSTWGKEQGSFTQGILTVKKLTVKK